MHEAEPVQQSLLQWIFVALGPAYLVLLPLTAFLSFVVALMIVVRGKGAMAAAALVLVVHIPLLIGLFAVFQGAISAFTVMAMSSATPKPADIAAGFSTALVAPFISLLLMVPGYFTAVIGAVVRSLAESPSSATHANL
ncbi:hypothetical protein [Novipirellula sp.]|uniref:hypothetical protein n=1 Tax=Novipirellula sp. TaxID=2795430 RepID=UPI003563AE9F